MALVANVPANLEKARSGLTRWDRGAVKNFPVLRSPHFSRNLKRKEEWGLRPGERNHLVDFQVDRNFSQGTKPIRPTGTREHVRHRTQLLEIVIGFVWAFAGTSKKLPRPQPPRLFFFGGYETAAVGFFCASKFSVSVKPRVCIPSGRFAATILVLRNKTRAFIWF